MGAEHDDQIEAAVREHLQPGETFRAAVWAGRADEGTSAGMTRAELSPFRFRSVNPKRRGYQPKARTVAAGLDEHMRNVTDPRVLALTDRRLLVLAKKLALFGGPAPALRLRWECARTELTSATEQGGRLRLAFRDGSTLTLLTPSDRVQPFLAG
ncbi:hypothetical protein Ade02nite_34480 [Paractinoplanes deccanensis]|uniref:Uncharacterized protein n=1 Tax=Paractinoplanes deccanensis TaxID=113561 RepID=A0ABQ3Y482_9ACTN|nr:hypothetical protein [Actinoplanes deccanensis]GID74807.1 hypothetical protein Ade02nite_34480 [Actinoplanes deccanensis]